LNTNFLLKISVSGAPWADISVVNSALKQRFGVGCAAGVLFAALKSHNFPVAVALLP